MIKKELESAPNTIILLVTWSGVEKIELTTTYTLTIFRSQKFLLANVDIRYVKNVYKIKRGSYMTQKNANY